MNCATKHFLAAGVSTLGLMVGAAQADIIHADDVIVDGSLCVGNDCVSGEAFGFDTLRLKENNLRIKFDDTSNSASFPRNDWQLTANDTSNGGAEKFSIDDITGSRTPFTILAGARTNALFVDAQGDVGFGTSNPVVGLHSVSGNTPTLRLEQDGSSGFTAQTWDVAGNEAGFFIRDATNGSTLPFRILPGASSQSLVIDGDNNVGIGAGTSPEAALHVKRATGGPAELFRLTNNAGGYIGLEDGSVAAGDNTGRIWNMQNIAGEYRITTAPGGGAEKELVLDADGNLTINGTITTSGSCSAGCDRVFDADYDLPSITEQREMMFANRHLPNVGPTAESGPMNLSDKIGGMLNELEKAHIYIGELHDQIEEQNNRIEELAAQINKG